MLYLYPAIKVAFNANTTLAAAFPGTAAGSRGIRNDWPDDVSAPFVLVTPIASPRDQTYGGAGFASPQLQFDVFALSLEAARQKMVTFIGVWDTITITLSSGAKFYSRRLTDPIPLPIVGRDENADNDVCGWSTTYEYAHT